MQHFYLWQLLTVTLIFINTENMSVKEVVTCMSNIFVSVSANESVVLPLGVGRPTSRFPDNSYSTPSASSVSRGSESSTLAMKRPYDEDDVLDNYDYNPEDTLQTSTESPAAKHRRLDSDLKQCMQCDVLNSLLSKYCGQCGSEFL
jgi:hypothetical protein